MDHDPSAEIETYYVKFRPRANTSIQTDKTLLCPCPEVVPGVNHKCAREYLASLEKPYRKVGQGGPGSFQTRTGPVPIYGRLGRGKQGYNSQGIVNGTSRENTWFCRRNQIVCQGGHVSGLLVGTTCVDTPEIISLQTPIGVYTPTHMFQWSTDTGNYLQAITSHAIKEISDHLPQCLGWRTCYCIWPKR